MKKNDGSLEGYRAIKSAFFVLFLPHCFTSRAAAGMLCKVRETKECMTKQEKCAYMHASIVYKQTLLLVLHPHLLCEINSFPTLILNLSLLREEIIQRASKKSAMTLLEQLS